MNWKSSIVVLRLLYPMKCERCICNVYRRVKWISSLVLSYETLKNADFKTHQCWVRWQEAIPPCHKWYFVYTLKFYPYFNLSFRPYGPVWYVFYRNYSMDFFNFLLESIFHKYWKVKKPDFLKIIFSVFIIEWTSQI